METDSIQHTEKRSTPKASEAKNTPVILVCINNNSGIVITNDFLFTIFSRYGKVLRILIFEKLKIWKAFVEYSNVESAIEAKKNLNNFLLFNDGTRISIYNSNLETVKFQSNNTGGVDYTLLETKNSSDLKDAPRIIEDPLAQFHNAINNLNNPNHVQEQNQQFHELENKTFEQTPRKESQGSKDDGVFNRSGDVKDIDEEQKIETNENKEFTSYLQSAYANTKARVTHVHSVPAQLYRDNPQLQQQQSKPQNISPTENSLPPGLMIHQFNQMPPSQGMQVQPGDPRLVRNAMSMNFIPLSDPSKQAPLLNRNPMSGELPNIQTSASLLSHIPQFGSMNNLPMPTSPSFGQSLGQDFGKFAQPIQKRPQLNTRFFSHQELPIMGLNNNPGIQRSVPLEQLMMNRDPNLIAMNQGGIPQVSGMGYDNMNRNTLSQLHSNIAVLLGKGDENKKSRVLYVKGLENKDIKVHMLYNIFSNFGNILKILFIPSKSSALLEFENTEYSTICMDYLNNIVFIGKPLRIFYSKYSIINLRNKKGEEPGEETFIGNQRTFRFKSNKNISINPPSSTLHL